MTDIRRSRRILIAWLIAYAALGLLGGLTGIGQRDEQAFSFIAGVPTMVFIYLWCRTESLERGALPRSGLTMFAALVAPLGVPFYLWRTRPTAGAAFKAIGGALAFYLLASVVLGGFESLGMAWRKE
ncbi:hypothetical protein EV672_102183 [Aquabacterium commune]|uniref:Uncharacterized protein n=1 Tax=Aquabacterium commune TaxID=70586 RepID=A0A4R6RHG2_9BURK|nr:hypothetical protein [Aquabacterium commune]TDP85833.1 hypothetical protein EV672_102183 [Aquabacterium commune]